MVKSRAAAAPGKAPGAAYECLGYGGGVELCASVNIESLIMSKEATTDRRALLSKNPLFGSLGPDELDELLSLSIVQKFDSNQLIFNRGDPGDGLYAIMDGRVGIKTVSKSGKEIFLNIMEKGEVFGEIALLDGKERTAGAVAIKPTELLFISRERFIPFLEKRPKLCIRLLVVLCSRLRWTSEIIEDTIFRDIRSRLAKRLLAFVEVYGVPVENGTKIDLKISQEDLGRMLGATRESINKELGTWQAQGVISHDHGYITLHDTKVLEHLAELS